MPEPIDNRKFVIIGGGPAGLGAGYELTKYNLHPLVLEKSGLVGGIARTENYKGYYFDMGGHRFYTKSAEVNEFWREVLGDDLLLRPRLSRIYYNHKFFNYPLNLMNALVGLGPIEGIRLGLSYLRWQILPYKQEDTFEQWVTNRFGQRLFKIFFKTYTEKVWGISTSELSAEWAAQRIRDLDLKTALLNIFIKPKQVTVSLIEEFLYPRQGPGMMWNRAKETIEQRNGEVRLNAEVIQINWNHTPALPIAKISAGDGKGQRVVSVVIDHAGQPELIEGSDFISSMPITEFIQKLNPPPPPEILAAASRLSYRDFLTVCLIVDQEQLFADNWIYIHDPDVRVGRIQNFKNWSPDMAPDLTKTSVGLEYFCNQGDDFWNMADADLIELGKRELEQIGLARASDVIDGAVFRVEKAYPVYDSTYREHLSVLREFVDSFANFQTIGRNGLHRYNNQDHAILTGMYAVRNALLGQNNNLWVVNAEDEYNEEIREKTRLVERVIDQTFEMAFARLNPYALGLAVGSVSGFLFFGLTIWGLLKGSGPAVDRLFLFEQYFPGYDVSFFPGSLLGLLYGFLLGFLLGWGVATLRNLAFKIIIWYLKRRLEVQKIEEIEYFTDHPSSGPIDME
jgi:protoporphyrinogen oxidase